MLWKNNDNFELQIIKIFYQRIRKFSIYYIGNKIHKKNYKLVFWWLSLT